MPKKYGNYKDWYTTRVKSLRSSFLRRAKKAGVDKSLVPSKAEIEVWLASKFDEHGVGVCYITSTPITYEEVEIDHLIPIARGGTFGLTNLGVTSKFLNGIKGSFTNKEFAKLLKVTKGDAEFYLELLNRLRQSNRFYNRPKRKRK